MNSGVVIVSEKMFKYANPNHLKFSTAQSSQAVETIAALCRNEIQLVAAF